MPTEKGLAALAKRGAALRKKKQETEDKAKAEKVPSRGSGTSELGPLDVERYLSHFGIPYEKKERDPRYDFTVYKITCLFNPDHGWDASIQQYDDGGLAYQCFHTGCKNVKRTWFDARRKISGEESLAPFCKGYDPNWKPSVKSASPSSSSKKKSGQKPYLIISEEGKRPRFVPAEMADWLESTFKPLMHEGRDFGDLFYQYRKYGVWKFLPYAELWRECRKELGKNAKPAWIRDAITLLEAQAYIGAPDEIAQDPMWLNITNTMLHLPTKKTAPHSPDYNSRVQLNVNYDKKAKCSLWIETLAGIYADDLEKADVLQQFFGYCLYPKIIFPAALFQIGQGRNGKALVEKVLCAVLGKDNVSHISMKRMEKDFGPIELKDKLLNSCGETEAKQLDVTNFKAIAAGDEIQAEVKYKSDIKFTPIAKHMISMNSFPGVKEKTDAFFRRIIVIEYKQSFEGKEDDKRRADKIIETELNGIFKWAMEGLEIVLENEEIQVPESVVMAKKRFRHKVNPALVFVDELCTLSKDDAKVTKVKVLPALLYKAYTDWCEDGKVQGLGKQNFYEQINLNFPKVKKRKDPKGTREFFYGIGLLANPHAIDI